MSHLAVIGAGRIGRAVTHALLCEGLFEEISIADVKPGLAEAFVEELKHVAASMNLDVEIHGFDKNEEISGADLVIITAGYPRIPGIKMERADLVVKNSRIVEKIAQIVPERNRGAKYLMVTNPVDVMATLFQKISRERFVISSGTHIDSLRLRSKLSDELNVPVSKIRGFVGGEHGKNAVILWSTVKILNTNIEEYLRFKGASLNKGDVEKYVKGISKAIIDSIGGTDIGPAAAVRDIVRAIVKGSGEVISVSIPMRFDLPQDVHVSVPVRIDRTLDLEPYEGLRDEEKKAIRQSAWKIYETYQLALNSINP